MDPMSILGDMTAEERTVMITAVEESYLSGVIGDFLGHAERHGAVWNFSGDADAIRALIPRFARVVRDMIARDLVEIREPADDAWDNAPSLSMSEVDAVLSDQRTWLWSAEGNNRMVMIMTTAYADRLLGR